MDQVPFYGPIAYVNQIQIMNNMQIDGPSAINGTCVNIKQMCAQQLGLQETT
jgi:hypothetical protein